MGAIRLFLAIAVVVTHVSDSVLDNVGMHAAPIWVLNLWAGRAVMFFYIVSGFLMSFVLAEKYPPTWAGTRAFYRARVLRIYPLWWALLLCALTASLARGVPVPSNPLPAFALFGSDWLVAFGNYPLQYWQNFPAFTAIGWTLGAEVTFYAIAPFVLRSLRASLGLFAASFALHAGLMVVLTPGVVPFGDLTYFFFPATVMFFMLGHLGHLVWRRWGLGPVSSSLLLAVAAVFSCMENTGTVYAIPSHLAALCFALALPGIFQATKDNRLSNFLGDLTYPLYLTHSMTIAAIFGPLIIFPGFGWSHIGTSPAIATAWIGAIALSVALAVHLTIEPLARAIVVRALFIWPRRLWEAARALGEPRFAPASRSRPTE